MHCNSRTSEQITTTNEPLQEPHPALYGQFTPLWVPNCHVISGTDHVADLSDTKFCYSL